MIAIVFGIQGVGKSTMVKKIIEKSKRADWALLQWGETAFDICVKQGIIRIGDYKELEQKEVITADDKRGVAIVKQGEGEFIYVKDQNSIKVAKDEIRHLSLKFQKQIQKEVVHYFRRLIGNDEKTNYIIETHAALKTKQGYLPGLPKEFLQSVVPDIYIIIEANAGDIFKRRLLDKERKREHDKTVQDVQTNLDTTRYFTSAFAAVTHSPMYIVQNQEGQAEAAAQEVAEVLLRFLD